MIRQGHLLTHTLQITLREYGGFFVSNELVKLVHRERGLETTTSSTSDMQGVVTFNIVLPDDPTVTFELEVRGKRLGAINLHQNKPSTSLTYRVSR
jgi:hypothetical protein